MADREILMGPGKLWRAPVGEAAPDETSVAFAAAWGGNWVVVGNFLEGQPVTISMTEEITKVRIEQSVGPRRAAVMSKETIVKVTLAEHGPTNMALLLRGTGAATGAGASQKAYTSIPFGNDLDVDNYKWGIEAFMFDTAGTKQPVRWFFHKGFIKLAGDIAYAKATPTGIPIEIHLLEDEGQSAGEELGILHIVTAPASS